MRVLSGLVAGSALLLGIGLSPALASSPAAGETRMLSVSPSGAPGIGESTEPALSADGRFVAFASTASNITGAPVAIKQVYVRDLTTGVTTLISSGPAGAGNGSSDAPAISADGSVVAYRSQATNILPFARSGVAQVFVWTRATNVTTLASLSNDLVPVLANRAVSNVAVSGDGTAVAFATEATNLTAHVGGRREVYVRDRTMGATRLVSVQPGQPDTGALGISDHPSLSNDGRFVAFSNDDKLSEVPTDKFTTHVYRRDMSSTATELVSVNATGTAGANADSVAPVMSADGTIIAFASYATDLGADKAADGFAAVYWRDMRGGATHLASRSVIDGSAAHGTSGEPAISADGTTIAFSSAARDLIREGRALDKETEVYTVDLVSGVTALVSRATRGADAADDTAGQASISSDGGLVSFASDASNLVPGTGIGSAAFGNHEIYLRDTTDLPRVERIGGADRFAVSAAVSADTFGTGVPAGTGIPVAYVAGGATFPDALSGSAAAGLQRAPVLLVTKDGIPASVDVELRRLAPKKIVVLGGPATIGDSVLAALRTYSPAVTRIGGADRFAVSAAVSGATFGLGGAVTPVAYVASGEVFPDALSGAAAAGYASGPVLLVRKDAIPQEVATELDRLHPGSIVVLGGRNTIDDSVVAALSKKAPTSRIDGVDRFAVSAAVSAATFPAGMRTAYIASGAVFPDALSGSAAAIRRVSPVLLVTADSIPAPVASELKRLKPTRIVVLGGPTTVSEVVLDQLRAYAMPPS